jgi:hypothetical protein
LARASACHAEGRGFESLHPLLTKTPHLAGFSCFSGYALVASFLGATTIRETGLDAWGWLAVIVLVLGLVAAEILLAPWKLKFAVDAPQLHEQLYKQAAAEADAGTLGWLAAAGYGY